MRLNRCQVSHTTKILTIVIGQIKDVIVGDIVYGHRNGAPIKKVVNPKVLGPQFIIEGGRLAGRGRKDELQRV